ncbi:hypothetical protein PGTUg99_025521 [Puccinia graminis f. sp. tritici]|uniref:Uncharacterized protein n=1 Tax=Puccinia graminis f. sp. tritici TaxID=56615 RepID=A0A5B0SLJ7_PUCGR|nr:hypothetical protein PGTUg99_025521 [Puccinia graminis f. sp. tritici]
MERTLPSICAYVVVPISRPKHMLFPGRLMPKNRSSLSQEETDLHAFRREEIRTQTTALIHRLLEAFKFLHYVASSTPIRFQGQSPSEESSWLEEGEMEEWVEMNEGVREAVSSMRVSMARSDLAVVKSTNTASEMDSMDNFSLGHHWTHHWNPHGLEVTPLWTHITKPIPSQAHVTTLKSPLSYAYTQLTVYT